MKIVSRISTRGYYDLTNGKTIKKNQYFFYPQQEYQKLLGSPELTIMVHGLQNNNAGAIAKVVLAKNRLRHLGYAFPVIGFSYDSNIRGAHLTRHARHALVVGQKIAKKNGRNLALFLQNFKDISPKTKIRLLGHSLGSLVILSTVTYLSKNIKNSNIIDSVYFFGASITNDVFSYKKYGQSLNDIIAKKIVNFYSPSDEVLSWANETKMIRGPLGLHGAIGKPIPKYKQRLVHPKNHRFASYIAVLDSFP